MQQHLPSARHVACLTLAAEPGAACNWQPRLVHNMHPAAGSAQHNHIVGSLSALLVGVLPSVGWDILMCLLQMRPDGPISPCRAFITLPAAPVRWILPCRCMLQLQLLRPVVAQLMGESRLLTVAWSPWVKVMHTGDTAPARAKMADTTVQMPSPAMSADAMTGMKRRASILLT